MGCSFKCIISCMGVSNNLRETLDKHLEVLTECRALDPLLGDPPSMNDIVNVGPNTQVDDISTHIHSDETSPWRFVPSV